ncbi:hypothetical protein ES692_01280 [Psychroserpens burtonensis]|uniref:RHS repeat protein n=1 Tax=Psychroserpens burtonensis TaxID=49278 RepID=A0A5C7BC87_9FLAO|nr:hypothetical protein [Psychroserpens burtonensis]TXE19920.1 hypothetical protein ES692_01280 [Psychroserpens burtonensis]
MLIKIQITIALFFCTISSFAQPNDTIYGNVKSIREQVVFTDSTHQNGKLLFTDGDYGHSGFISPKWTKNRFSYLWYNTPWVHYINYNRIFNIRGNTISETWYYKNNDTMINQTYVYDNEKNLVQVKEKYGEEGFSSSNYTYNSKKEIITELNYITDEPKIYSYLIYRYDSISNLIEIKRFNGEGESTSKIYKYDDKSRRIEDLRNRSYKNVKAESGYEQLKGVVGVNKIYKKYSYNENNQIIETQTFDSSLNNGKLSEPNSSVINLYENGLLVEVQKIRDTLINTTKYYYDNRKRLIKKAKISAKYSEYNQLLEYMYNKEDNIIKLIYSDAEGTKRIRILYEFDKQNNWIKQIKSINGVDLYIWEREIKYHN